MKYTPKIGKVYHNNRVFHPDGHFMFYTSDRKINFYLKNNLAKVLAIYPEGHSDIQLTFEPKGNGCVTEYDLSMKENICVITGDSENLTQHHVVPVMYSKHFPITMKNNNSHDVLLVTVPLHSKYEREANILKDELAKKYGAPTLFEYNKQDVIRDQLHKSTVAYTLYNYEEKMPPKRQQELRRQFIEITGLEPTIENYKEIMKLPHKFTIDKQYGELFVPLISDLEEFCVIWRKHFIDIMNPKFMPKGWSIYGNKQT